MAEWQPIESAPDDGTSVLLFVPGEQTHWRGLTSNFVVAHMSGGGEWFDKSEPIYNPTHWMPLPTPPAA